MTYYYASSRFRNVYKDDNNETGLGAFAVFFIIALVAGGMVGIFIIYRRYKSRISAKVAF